MNQLDTAVDKVLDVHLILDNYSTHKTKQVQNWLKRHKRFKLHFIPTSSARATLAAVKAGNQPLAAVKAGNQPLESVH